MTRTYEAEPEFEKIKKFLEDFESDSFENVFVKWNQEMREKSNQNISDLCKKIKDSKASNEWQLTTQEISQPLLEDEEIISNVILRIYNNHPAVYIKTPLSKFIIDVASQLHDVSQKLFKLGQRDDKNSLV